MRPEIAAEAAVWVARLHGPNRSSRMEQEFLKWQARSAEHQLAFERCTDTWEMVGGVTSAEYASAVSRSEVSLGSVDAPRIRRRAWTLAAAAVLALVCVAYHRGDLETFETGIGERRTVVLRDGSRMSLNTASRVHVRLLPEQRFIELETGEAMFEVAKDPRHPFVVHSDGMQVRATGTTFVVRSAGGSSVRSAGVARSAGTLSVTLIEGRVVVDGGERKGFHAESGPSTPIELAPGERLRIATPMSLNKSVRTSVVIAKDRPRMDQAVAWQRGEAVFDDALLPEALAEMNRYSATPIEIAADGTGEGLRVSGVFRTGDNVSFARALAKLHGLRVVERAGRIELQH